MIYGYARVSTDGQSLDAQVDELKAAGCQQVFQEKMSGGGRSDRRGLARVMAKLGKGDTLVVCRLDRLARSSRDLLNILYEIGLKEAKFRSLRDPWADTTSPHGRLMLTVLGGLAEGRERAMLLGVRFGRKPKLTQHQKREALARRQSGETLTAIARSYDVSHSTISRLA